MEETTNKKIFPGISSFTLHVLAMFIMLLDHLWATTFPDIRLLTIIGRIAFPIFAFMIVEGFYRTKNLKKYILRMLFFAIISEIPFNMMYSGLVIYPYHQNVMWTFLISIIGMALMDKAKYSGKLWLNIITKILVVVIGTLLGFLLMVDYYGVGVLMVFLFYFTYERKTWHWLIIVIIMNWLNSEVLGGRTYNIELFGNTYEIVEQSMALLALIPIWLYRGRQGYHKKWFQYFCYAFYPLHMLLLAILN